MLTLGILFSVIGWLQDLNILFSCGCVLIICSVGLTLQACFWGRSQPNKFSISEILRVTALAEVQGLQRGLGDFDELVKENESQETESVTTEGHQQKKASLPSQPNGAGRNNSVGSAAGLLEVRRLSIAMTRAATELRHAANQHATAGAPGLANFARRLTLEGNGLPQYMAPTAYEGAINWHGQYSSAEISRIRRLSQWQNIA